MIEFLRGRLDHRQPTRLVIDVGGVGMGVDVSLRTAERFPTVGETVRILTYLHVREESLDLYGFQDLAEKALFLKLLSVSILAGDIRGLTALKGIGKKTAEVMVASLRTSMAKLDLPPPGEDGNPVPGDEGGEAARDAVLALISLGVKDNAAQSAVQKAQSRLGPAAQANQLIAQALQEV
jgi:Holliday junction DNA helicase RuvA